MPAPIAALLAALLYLAPALAGAQDFDEYARLLQRAQASHDLLDGAPPDRQGALAETALEADYALIEWLDAFIASPAFGDLSSEEHDVVVRNRYRWEYNAAVLLMQLDRCEEARDRVRTLLDSSVSDAELRPRLTGAYEDAIACATRDRVAYLTVDASPAGAEVYVDGVLAGLAGANLEVTEGRHEVTVRARGFQPQTLSLDAREGETHTLGPVLLLAAAEPGLGMPTWYEWTLMGGGVGGLVTGVLFFTAAGGHDDDIENPPDGFRVADLDAEQDVVEDLQFYGAIFTTVGAVALGAGLISYFVRDRGDGDGDGDLAFGVGLGGFTLSGTF